MEFCSPPALATAGIPPAPREFERTQRGRQMFQATNRPQRFSRTPNSIGQKRRDCLPLQTTDSSAEIRIGYLHSAANPYTMWNHLTPRSTTMSLFSPGQLRRNGIAIAHSRPIEPRLFMVQWV